MSARDFLENLCKYKEVIQYGIENEITFLGFIRGENNISQLSPSKNVVVYNSDRLIYLSERDSI